ncbi:MAG: hypothetical protein K8R87_01270 [Verrucomicrobia bacterium]|nr:hypothetical protein [Verrucomicrobiota bacterium]
MILQHYQIIHLIAVMILFAGTGAALAGTDHGGTRKFGAILRGVSLLLLLVTGFGLLAKLGIMKSLPVWAWIKLAIWVIAAVLPVFVKRKMLPGTAAVLIALALGGVAAWLGIMKPF